MPWWPGQRTQRLRAQMKCTDVQAQPPLFGPGAPQFAPRDLDPIRTRQGTLPASTSVPSDEHVDTDHGAVLGALLAGEDPEARAR